MLGVDFGVLVFLYVEAVCFFVGCFGLDVGYCFLDGFDEVALERGCYE